MGTQEGSISRSAVRLKVTETSKHRRGILKRPSEASSRASRRTSRIAWNLLSCVNRMCGKKIDRRPPRCCDPRPVTTTRSHLYNVKKNARTEETKTQKQNKPKRKKPQKSLKSLKQNSNMDWKLLLASFLVLVINVSAQAKGNNECVYGGARYRAGTRFKNIQYPNCYCACALVNGAPKVDCDTTQCKPDDKCVYNGKSFSVGQQFPAKDNCGQCICKVGKKVECNIPNQCKPTPAPITTCAASAETMGTIRMSGAMWESPDKCKKYTCTNGKVIASDQICKCVYNGQNFALGQTFNVKCNVCRCNQNGMVTCSQNKCECTFNNQLLQPGQSVPAPDGCNTCTCGANLQMSCSKKPCECVRNGQKYRIGQTFPAGDGCNNCRCNENGAATCSSNKCSCIENGITYTIGQSFKKDCNTCRCTQTGAIVCTLMACPTPAPKCVYNGVEVEVGKTVTDADGCTVHTCQSGANLVSDNGVNCECNYNGIQYARSQTFAKPGDQCGNTCTCQALGLQVTCTSNVCCRNPNTNLPMRVGEAYANECNQCRCTASGQVQCENKVCFCFGNTGQKYKIGLSWIHTDGCNTCTCTQTGMITCDTKKCECEYNGQKHRIGATGIPHLDGCQTCQCSANAEIICDKKVCSCKYMGRVVQIGSTFDKGDGCNTCQCQQNGQVSCQNNPVPCKCQYQGMTLNIGETRQKDCNTCTCMADGQVSCSNNPCNCQYNGRTYSFGQTFSKGDSCNTCTCQTTGQVECTNNPCGCSYNGRTIDIGATFNKDECNTCTCMSNAQLECSNNPVPCNCKYQGQVIPLGTKVQKQCNTCECKSNGQLECSQNPCSCQYQGMTYTIGQEFDVVGKPCTKCRCLVSGQVDCDSSACTPPPLTSGCRKNGTVYEIGKTFKDDCNTCMCAKQSNGEAVITCTKKVCGCQDPTQPGKIFKSGEKWQKEGNCVTCECLPSFNVNCVKTCNTKTGRR